MLENQFKILGQALNSCIDTLFLTDKSPEWYIRKDVFNFRDSENLPEEWNNLDDTAKLIVLLALSPRLAPWALQGLKERTLSYPWLFSIGGKQHAEFGYFQPTIRTALLLIAGLNTNTRNKITSEYLLPESILFRKNILKSLHEDPFLDDSLLECTPEFIYKLTTGKEFIYRFSPQFPAEAVSSKHEWEDLVVNYSTRRQLEDLKLALKHHQSLVDHPDLGRSFRENHIALFYGDPGTGKTMAAGLLGKSLGLAVYKIDLSRVVSKWVGETSKNLRNLFDIAEQKNWILFFDEADALFGSRSSQGGGSNDQYHNQDISYLLQRIDTFRGFAILSTNLRSNMDKAFSRRIDDKIYFPSPDNDLRRELWEKIIERSGLTFTEREYIGRSALQQILVPGDWDVPDNGINIREIAEFWELSGAHMVKIMKYILMLTYERKVNHMTSGIFMQGLVRELQAQGKSWKG